MTPLDDTIWARSYGSTAAVQAAFNRLGSGYADAIVETGLPARVAEILAPTVGTGDRLLDFGCGPGVLGVVLQEKGASLLDGIDFSPVMLDLARATGCYDRLWSANLLVSAEFPDLEGRTYAGGLSLGLIGDYVPYYLLLPRMKRVVGPGGWLGFSVERTCTPWLALEKLSGN